MAAQKITNHQETEAMNDKEQLLVNRRRVITAALTAAAGSAAAGCTPRPADENCRPDLVGL